LDQTKFYKQATRSNQTYFVKTHDAPCDNAKAIYIIRDGRSAIISYYHYMRNFADAAVSVRDIVVGECLFGSWGQHLKRWAPIERPNTLLLRYDDLVGNPSEAVKSVSAFIGRPISRRSFPSFSDLKTTNSNFFRSGNDAENIDQMKQDDLNMFWLLHGDMMLKYGFARAV
jgi:Sulfotransferase domain